MHRRPSEARVFVSHRGPVAPLRVWVTSAHLEINGFMLPPRRRIYLHDIAWCRQVSAYCLERPMVPFGVARYGVRGDRVYSPRLALSAYGFVSGVELETHSGARVFVQVRQAAELVAELATHGVRVVDGAAPARVAPG